MLPERVNWYVIVFMVDSVVTDLDGNETPNANPFSDPNSPYYMHHNDYPRKICVDESLIDNKYSDWSRKIKAFLFAKNCVKFIDKSIIQPDSSELKPWQQSDVIIKRWRMTTMEKDFKNIVKPANTTKEIWGDLEERFNKESTPWEYKLKHTLIWLR